jgi:hypothetical protein
MVVVISIPSSWSFFPYVTVSERLQGETVSHRPIEARCAILVTEPATEFNPNSAVEGEAQDKAQAFRSERNGPVPLSAVAGIDAMSSVLNRCERSAK